MPNDKKAAFDNYWSVIIRAGMTATRRELLSLIGANSDALDEGALATMRLLAEGSLRMEEAFTTLDAAKGIATRHLTTRSAAARAGKKFDVILNRADPGHLSYYLKQRRHPTAIVSFHLVGRNRLAIFVAANSPTNSGIRGFGGVYYDCIWLDGLRADIVGSLEEYASSLARGDPDHKLRQTLFDFLGSAIFFLLGGPKPDEVIFIPHKLLHVLPLHAISLEHDGGRVYLHDMVRTIRYVSSLADLIHGSISFSDEEGERRRAPRFLSVLDIESGLGGVLLEQKCVESYRRQLEPQGVTFDVVTEAARLPRDYRDYFWVSWSSHAGSSPNEWGDSFLTLGDHRISALTVASDWLFEMRPVVVLAACETSVDTSGGLSTDEYCGLDLAFRIAGASAVIASLWPVEDMVAALTAMLVPAWWFKGRLSPGDAVTAIQRQLRAGTWKEFLLREDQLRQLQPAAAKAVREVQEPFLTLSDDAFADESSWAAFRSHGN